ncbi:MAG: hypothetical protein QM204_06335 [Bacillota bacterium]|mgnify:CR=1 FL=1|jgi:uncharacterized membrane protein YidH (DUF202 family)|nr:hypothetical protein [Bacillota bacterium]NLL26821.1 hypothetical protein [Erysipelotrichia bacterium]
MNQTVRAVGIIFCILFAIISTFLNNRFRKDLESSIQNNHPDIEKQTKKYLLFLSVTIMVIILFTIIIILLK